MNSNVLVVQRFLILQRCFCFDRFLLLTLFLNSLNRLKIHPSEPRRKQPNKISLNCLQELLNFIWLKCLHMIFMFIKLFFNHHGGPRIRMIFQNTFVELLLNLSRTYFFPEFRSYLFSIVNHSFSHTISWEFRENFNRCFQVLREFRRYFKVLNSPQFRECSCKLHFWIFYCKTNFWIFSVNFISESSLVDYISEFSPAIYRCLFILMRNTNIF